MTKRRILAAIISALAVSGVVGANLAHAGSSSSTPAVERNANAGEDREGTGTEAEEPDEAEEADEAGEPEEAEGSEQKGAEVAEAEEADSHEDAGPNAQHECPPDCDTANGETP